jgi:TRAP-type C4-dicarboxylate transport system substrate-binding protein
LHLAGAAAAAALTMSTALAQDVTFTAGTIGVPAMISTQELENFAKEVGEESGGRIEIKVYTNSQLGSGQEQMEAVAFGTQDIFLSALSEASRLVPSFGALDAAFLFKDEDHVRRFMESDMWSTLETRLADEFGVGIITANWFDLPRHLLHREKFISEVEDVAGVRVRAPGIPMYIQNYINMGAEPITIAYGEQYLALSQGVVDMTESAADRIMGLKLHEVAPYITEADMMFPLSALYVNQAKWDALSEEDRAMMSRLAQDAADRAMARTRDSWGEVKATIEAEGGKFQPMPEETRAAFAEMATRNLDDMESSGLFPEGWYQAILDLRDAE